MKRPIGFLTTDEQEAQSAAAPVSERVGAAVSSLVRVRFRSGASAMYYNSCFDLREGDVVYVGGKWAKEAGVVVAVNTKFRIHTADYERVLSLLDLSIHGTFARVGDKMVSFDPFALDAERFGAWITPPYDPRQEQDAPDDEVVSGEGYRIDLCAPEDCEDITPAVAARAVTYRNEGRVRYLSLYRGVGRAYVEGSRWYRVDFCCRDGVMTDIFCDCPYPYLCKHETAVALTLRMLLRQPQMQSVEDFVAIDRQTFLALTAHANAVIL